MKLETNLAIQIHKSLDLGIKVRPFRVTERKRICNHSSNAKNFVKLLFVILLLVSGLLFPLRLSLNSTSAESPITYFTESEVEPKLLPLEKGLGLRYILVNLADQTVQLYDGGERIFEGIVSSGHDGRPTPKGEFKIINKAPRAYSKVARLYMPYWMAFTYDGQYWLGFHELPEYPDGTKEGEEHLGLPYSGGCIRLGVGEAEEFYNMVQIGDKVKVF